MEPSLPPIALSRQEQRVIALSMQGLGDKEIAREMDLAVGTVRTYWKRIQSKVGGQTRAEIVSIVARLGPQQELREERSINALLKAEIAQRREAEERFRAICACSPIGIYVSSPEGACTYVNPAWERITGFPFSATKGFDWKKLVHPDDYDRLDRWSQNQLSGAEPQSIEFRFLSSKGTMWVRSSYSAMIVDGRVLGYVGTIEDVTDCPLRERRVDERALAGV